MASRYAAVMDDDFQVLANTYPMLSSKGCHLMNGCTSNMNELTICNERWFATRGLGALQCMMTSSTNVVRLIDCGHGALRVHFGMLFGILSLHFFLHFGALFGTLLVHSGTLLLHFLIHFGALFDTLLVHSGTLFDTLLVHFFLHFFIHPGTYLHAFANLYFGHILPIS